MSKFGQTLRELRAAQQLGLRETATIAKISPAYLSRIERGKEPPPSATVILQLAKVLAADPDVLLRLASQTDPELVAHLTSSPETTALLRHLVSLQLSDEQLQKLKSYADRIKAQSRA